MSHATRAPDGPNGEMDAARTHLDALREHLGKLSGSISQLQNVLTRLEKSHRTGNISDQPKAVRESMMQLLMFQALEEQISQSFGALDAPIKALIEDTAQHGTDRERLAALEASADALSSSLEPSEVLYQAMDTLIRISGAERAFLMMADDETGEMQFQVSRNFEEQSLRGTSFAVSRTIIDQVVKEGRPIVTTNAAADPRFKAQESIAIHALRSIACVPLKTNEKVIGVIYADHRIKMANFSETDVEFIAAFANQASTAIQNARLFESVSVARNLMHNVFESMPSGVITTDTDGVITLFNRAAESIRNINSGECLNLPSTLVLPLLDGMLIDLVEKVLVKESIIEKNGVEGEINGRGLVSFNLSAGPIRDAGGELQGVALLVEDRTESMQFKHERQLVKRYLPSQLVDSFSDLSDLQLGGARETVSVFFADIRGFTGFSEDRDPKEVVDVINAYFGIASEVIEANHGIVDKYMGDAVMAHYNSPLLSLEDHAWFAVKTAWEIKQRFEAFLSSEENTQQLQFGSGVNTGVALAGNVGASNRMEYTLIGDAVNVAKRLQEGARAGEILLAATTYELVKERVLVSDPVVKQIKGRDAGETVYPLIDLLELP